MSTGPAPVLVVWGSRERSPRWPAPHARWERLQLDAVALARTEKRVPGDESVRMAYDVAEVDIEARAGGHVRRLHAGTQVDERWEPTRTIAFATRQVVLEAKRSR